MQPSKHFWFHFPTLEVFLWIYSAEDQTRAKKYLESVRGGKDPLPFHPCSPAPASLPCHSLLAWVQGAVPGQSPDVHIQERGLKGKESPKAYCSIAWRQPAEKWLPRLCQVNDFKHSSPSPILIAGCLSGCHQDLSFSETLSMLCNMIQITLRTAEAKKNQIPAHTFFFWNIKDVDVQWRNVATCASTYAPRYLKGSGGQERAGEIILTAQPINASS